MIINTFEDIIAWQKAKQLAIHVYSGINYVYD